MSIRSRKREEMIFLWVMRLALIIISATLGVILLSICMKGIPSLSWEMITETPKGGYYYGKSGGILNAIVGSLWLATGATILALIIGLPVALYINVYLVRRKKLAETFRFILDLLWGIPSIVYGALAFTVMVYLGMRTTLLAGMLTVAVFILPIMIRSMDEVLKTVPRGLMESALSLGSTRSETAFKVYLRQCIPGLVTAIMLSFGRAIGDAAAVLFTTGYTDHIPDSFTRPAATLPLAIFFQLSSPIEEVRNRAFAAAVILTAIILVISISSRFISRKYRKQSIRF
jgi:phosphate transport system permease protein